MTGVQTCALPISFRPDSLVFNGNSQGGIMGGALVPLAIGYLGDHYGLRSGLCLLYLTFGLIFTIGFWARPLVNNARAGDAL